jgi:activator of HSP90 ATPase
MSKTITETFEFEGISSKELYKICMDSEKMSRITGYDTVISDKSGDKFTALNGGVKGQNLHIIPEKMIVQSWRWLTRKREYDDSIMVAVFYDYERGAKIDLININVPDNEMPFINRDTYLEPLKNFLKSELKATV